MPRVQVRLLKSQDEYRECERIQKAVWGTYAVSSEVLTVTQKYGGAVLGAIVERKVVGFIYAFLARRHGHLVHWSHMMAVEPGHRDQGLGFRMKLAHREIALVRGVSSICWTYDPLQSRNATLNLAKLGARPDEYIPNCYGQFTSVIERRLPSDRFAVEWRIGSAGVERRLSQARRRSRRVSSPVLEKLMALPRANETRPIAAGYIENRSIALNLQGPRLLVEIPSNTDAMRRDRLALAKRWRMEGRTIFTHYLASNYRVDDFIPPGPDTSGRCFYVLCRAQRESAAYR
jgi:predicted GNAT superfamily acetyltransferase